VFFKAKDEILTHNHQNALVFGAALTFVVFGSVNVFRQNVLRLTVMEANMTDAQHVLFNIKTATFTLKYKGSEKFLLEQLTEVAKEFANMPFNGNVANLPNGSDQQSENKIIKSARQELTTHTIARQLNAKTGKEVTIAAMAKLYFIEDQTSAQRHTILSAMQEATPIYKDSMRSNLTRIIKGLLSDGALVKFRNNHYSLSDQEIQKLGPMIDGIN
jgi:hypothetical protein